MRHYVKKYLVGIGISCIFAVIKIKTYVIFSYLDFMRILGT